MCKKLIDKKYFQAWLNPSWTVVMIQIEWWRGLRVTLRFGRLVMRIAKITCDHTAHNWNLQENGAWFCRRCGKVMMHEEAIKADNS